MDNKNQQSGYQITQSQGIQGNADNNYQPGQEFQQHHHGQEFGQSQHHGQEFGQSQHHGQEFGQSQHHGQEFGQSQHHGQEFGQSQHHGQEFGQSQHHGQEFGQSQHHGQEFGQSQYHGQQFGQSQYHGQQFGQPQYHSPLPPANQNLRQNLPGVDHSIKPEQRGLTGITSCEQLWKMSCCFQGRPTWKFWIFLAYFLAMAASIGTVIVGIIVVANTPSSYYLGPRPSYYPTPTSRRPGIPTFTSRTFTTSRPGIPPTFAPSRSGIPTITVSSAIPSASYSISSVLGLVIMDVFIILTVFM